MHTRLTDGWMDGHATRTILLPQNSAELKTIKSDDPVHYSEEITQLRQNPSNLVILCFTVRRLHKKLKSKNHLIMTMFITVRRLLITPVKSLYA
jgi:hypothetical protein